MNDELTELRAFKAACERQEAYAFDSESAGLVFEDHYTDTKPLYLCPDPEAAQLRMRLANALDWIGAQNEVIAELNKELAERDQQVAEACAAECEGIDAINSRGWGDFLAKRIRSGEWKKHMKGVE